MALVEVTRNDGVATVALNRPEVRNAFDDVMLGELAAAFNGLGEDVHVVVLTGRGTAFCSGADLGWMARLKQTGTAESNDSEAIARVFRLIDEFPRPVIGRINGPALGGALGLMACCDVAIAVDTVKFAFTEVRRGIVPAVISPFVVRKTGYAQARRYFVTGEDFDAQTARSLGLVHEVVAASELDASVERMVKTLQGNGPVAMGEAKRLVGEVSRRELDSALQYATALLARLRASPEAQEGIRAFLEKRPPRWGGKES